VATRAGAFVCWASSPATSAQVRTPAIGALIDKYSSRTPWCRRLSADMRYAGPAESAADARPARIWLFHQMSAATQPVWQLLRSVRRHQFFDQIRRGFARRQALKIDWTSVFPMRRHGIGAHLSARRKDRRTVSGTSLGSGCPKAAGAAEFSRPEVLRSCANISGARSARKGGK